VSIPGFTDLAIPLTDQRRVQMMNISHLLIFVALELSLWPAVFAGSPESSSGCCHASIQVYNLQSRFDPRIVDAIPLTFVSCAIRHKYSNQV
jgi:hypothetical protein